MKEMEIGDERFLPSVGRSVRCVLSIRGGDCRWCCLDEVGCKEVGACVSEFRQDGHEVVMEWADEPETRERIQSEIARIRKASSGCRDMKVDVDDLLDLLENLIDLFPVSGQQDY